MSVLPRPWHRVSALRQHWNAPNRAIVVNAGSMAMATAASSVFGAAYWWLAARAFPPAAVGLASATVSAMTLLGTIGVLGLGTLLIGELPRQPSKAPALVMTALLVTGAAGSLFGVIFALGAPLLSAEFNPLAASPVTVVLFGLGAGLTALSLVLDQALLGLLRGGLQLWRNIIFAAAKLALLAGVALWLSDRLGMTILATWVAGNIISLAALAAFVVATRQPGRHWQPQWMLLRGLGWEALRHHLLNVSLLLTSLTLPLVVTLLLSATMTAYFYMASMIVALIVVVPAALTTLLYRMGAADPLALARRARFTFGLSVLISLLANGMLFAASGPVLSLFGPSYVEHAVWPLRILGLNVFPIIVREHYVAINRVHGRLTYAVGPVVLGALLSLGGAAVGAQLGGLVGLSIGVLIALVIEALYMAPPVMRLLATPEPAASRMGTQSRSAES